eukprot:scaffold2417_cov111-Skeletonema_dohrnii-CCMP3373.AAC.5
MEPVDCSIHSVRYDIVLEWFSQPCQIRPHQVTYETREIRYGCQQRSLLPSQMPHQVTYDIVATLIRPTNV